LVQGSSSVRLHWRTYHEDAFQSVIYVNSAAISALTPGIGLVHDILTEISFSQSKISDLSNLCGCTNLRHLFLSYTLVSDLAPLTRLQSRLEGLALSGSPIEDISPVSSLAYLTWLDLSDTRVSSVKALSGNLKLDWLQLEHTLVTDLRPLGNLQNLRHLHLAGTNFDVSTLDAFAENFQITIFIAEFPADSPTFALERILEEIVSGHGVLSHVLPKASEAELMAEMEEVSTHNQQVHLAEQIPFKLGKISDIFDVFLQAPLEMTTYVFLRSIHYE
jgi:hypothetical protein